MGAGESGESVVLGSVGVSVDSAASTIQADREVSAGTGGEGVVNVVAEGLLGAMPADGGDHDGAEGVFRAI